MTAWLVGYLVAGLMLEAGFGDGGSRESVLRIVTWPIGAVWAIGYWLHRMWIQGKNTYYCALFSQKGPQADPRAWRIAWKFHPKRMAFFCWLLGQPAAQPEGSKR